MTATTQRDLPAMPVDSPEMHDMCEAIDSGDLTPELRKRLRGLIIAFCSLDQSDTASAGRWEIARQDWREFVAAWREEHPLPEADAS